MRSWRVGTISMGVALLFLGLYLLFSNLLGLKVASIFSAWWPIILVIVGLEILLYLFFQKQEKAMIKFDFLSIIFVGLLGTVGIGFSILHSLGVVEAVSHTLDREYQTNNLPTFSEKLDSNIKRIVLKTSTQPVTIESSATSEVSMFGTYQARTTTDEVLLAETEDYVFTETKGDTLYMQIKELPEGTWGYNSYAASLDLTVLVPSDVKLEVEGQDNMITLKPRQLLAAWEIERGMEVNLSVGETANLTVSADVYGEISGEGWSVEDTVDGKIGQFQKGAEGAKIMISRSAQVNLFNQ